MRAGESVGVVGRLAGQEIEMDLRAARAFGERDDTSEDGIDLVPPVTTIAPTTTRSARRASSRNVHTKPVPVHLLDVAGDVHLDLGSHHVLLWRLIGLSEDGPNTDSSLTDPAIDA